MKRILALFALVVISIPLQSFATKELDFRITNLECKKLNSRDGMNHSEEIVVVPCDRKTLKRFKKPEVRFTINDIFLFCVNDVCATRDSANEQNNYTTVNGGWVTEWYSEEDARFNVPVCKIGSPKCPNSQITRTGYLRKGKDGSFKYVEGFYRRTFDNLGIHSETDGNIFVLKLEKN